MKQRSGPENSSLRSLLGVIYDGQEVRGFDMTHAEIVDCFHATIDQYYAELRYMRSGYREESEVWHIGGILQSALHILPTDMYYGLKQYIYRNYGYDPGGCSDQQISLNEWKEGKA